MTLPVLFCVPICPHKTSLLAQGTAKRVSRKRAASDAAEEGAARGPQLDDDDERVGAGGAGKSQANDDEDMCAGRSHAAARLRKPLRARHVWLCARDLRSYNGRFVGVVFYFPIASSVASSGFLIL